MPKYYCEYCDIYLTHSSPVGRRQHAHGRKHVSAKIEYFQNLLREEGITAQNFLAYLNNRTYADLGNFIEGDFNMYMKYPLKMNPYALRSSSYPLATNKYIRGHYIPNQQKYINPKYIKPLYGNNQIINTMNYPNQKRININPNINKNMKTNIPTYHVSTYSNMSTYPNIPNNIPNINMPNIIPNNIPNMISNNLPNNLSNTNISTSNGINRQNVVGSNIPQASINTNINLQSNELNTENKESKENKENIKNTSTTIGPNIPLNI